MVYVLLLKAVGAQDQQAVDFNSAVAYREYEELGTTRPEALALLEIDPQLVPR